ncbi:MAG: hypothetical protein ACJAWL_002159 [Motiliproteus sp.]|jgi:hypothetical protein
MSPICFFIQGSYKAHKKASPGLAFLVVRVGAAGFRPI